MALTRKAAAIQQKVLQDINKLVNAGKRPAERSPPHKRLNKRAALGEITNKAKIPAQLGGKKSSKIPKKSGGLKKSQKQTEESIDLADSSWEFIDSQKSSQSSYRSSQSSQKSSQSCSQVSLTSSQSSDDQLSQEEKENVEETLHHVIQAPDGLDRLGGEKTEEVEQLPYEDIDAENAGDIFQISDYAFEIFEYYKERESQFMIDKYLERQTEITANMRAIVVDWLVEIQENFELNHETLYLAIRLVDLYLQKVLVKRDKLQLVAATGLFIACKFDERIPPLLDDFLFICDDAYTRPQILKMEMEVLRTLGFDLGLPSSYRFLRRYSKCARGSMELLTLSRYILEMAQMEYDFLVYRDSEMASACLLLALKMKDAGEWTPTLVHYTGYKEEEILPLVGKLNTMLKTPSHKNLQTIRTKYSHKVFFEVAKTPTLDL